MCIPLWTLIRLKLIRTSANFVIRGCYHSTSSGHLPDTIPDDGNILPAARVSIPLRPLLRLEHLRTSPKNDYVLLFRDTEADD